MDAGADGFYRKKGVGPAPHNVYGTPQTFWDQADADHTALPPTQFVIAKSPEKAGAAVAGSPSSTVAVHLSGYSRPTWTWDAGTGTWLRAEGAAPAIAALGCPDRRDERRHAEGARGGLGHDATRPATRSRRPCWRGRVTRPCPAAARRSRCTWSKTATDAVLTLAAADGVGADARARDHLGRARPGRARARSRSAEDGQAPPRGPVAWQPGRVQANDGGAR